LLQVVEKINSQTNKRSMTSQILEDQYKESVADVNMNSFNIETNEDDVGDDNSIRSDSDLDSEIPKQQTTDEDTKECSEEESSFSPSDKKQQDVANQITESDQVTTTQEYESLVQRTQSRTGKITKDDFTLIQVIGTGSYGKVLLVKKKGTDKLFAMKILKKKFVRKQKQV
jgi:hypothetical protein